MSADSIMAAALTLPAEARARLAEQLLESLEPASDQRETDTAWVDEVERRIDALDRGEAKMVPAERTLRDARLR